jgi:SAM-dependent methyltransferase
MIRGKGGPFGFGQGDLSLEDEKRYPQFTYRQYIQEGSIPKDWWEIEMLNSNSHERVGFETQKPEALLERIIKASSHPGDLVADFFCGSGTTLVAAEKLGRRWLGADFSPAAIHTTRKRLLQIPHCRPFELLGPGNYRKEKLKEVNRLEMGHQWEGTALTIFLKGFVLCDQDYLPEGLKAKFKHPLDYIDYWAVDFDWQGEVFHSMWQSFRSRRHRHLQTRCSHSYEKEGQHKVKVKVLVKAVDIFGNETSALLNLATQAAAAGKGEGR